MLPIIRNHHERWDGSGYPDGLAGEKIPLLARILQVVDIYDALTTERPYKPAFSHSEAVQLMQEEAERGWRDPELIPLFAEIATGIDTDLASMWRPGTYDEADSSTRSGNVQTMAAEISGINPNPKNTGT